MVPIKSQECRGSPSGLKGISYKMARPVHISQLSCARGTTIGLKSVEICPRPAHFWPRFFKSDTLLGKNSMQVRK